MRPMLRPGLNVLRRDPRTLQLGLEWPGVAAVQASPSIRAVLDAVDGFRDIAGVVLAATAQGVPADDARHALEALLDAGVLVDQAVVRPPAVPDPTWSGFWLLAGPRSTASGVLKSRQTALVHVPVTGQVARLVAGLLAQEQLPMTPDANAATLLVVAADQEPSRDVADEAMRSGRPFLCVGVRELVGLVGPFVVPGRTACLRCVDLSRSQLDPCWPTLLAAAQSGPAKVASCPPSLIAATAAYAAQEIALWGSGALPVCCDSVVEIPHGLGEVQTIAYPPHPECGCGWRTGHETMGA